MVWQTKTSAETLKLALVMTRQQTSLMERAILSDGPHIRRCRRNWVRAWIDDGHVVLGDQPGTEARRAITDAGDLIWMVHQAGKRDAYHAEAQDPVEAMEAARQARARRRAIRLRWGEALALRRDVLARRTRLTVRVADAHAAGLCPLGVAGFMHRMGMGAGRDVAGYWVALSSYADPQALFALMAAAERAGVVASALKADRVVAQTG